MFSGIFYTSVRLGERCQGGHPDLSATMAEKLSSFPEKPITSTGLYLCARLGPWAGCPESWLGQSYGNCVLLEKKGRFKDYAAQKNERIIDATIGKVLNAYGLLCFYCASADGLRR